MPTNQEFLDTALRARRARRENTYGTVAALVGASGESLGGRRSAYDAFQARRPQEDTMSRREKIAQQTELAGTMQDAELEREQEWGRNARAVMKTNLEAAKAWLSYLADITATQQRAASTAAKTRFDGASANLDARIGELNSYIETNDATQGTLAALDDAIAARDKAVAVASNPQRPSSTGEVADPAAALAAARAAQAQVQAAAEQVRNQALQQVGADGVAPADRAQAALTLEGLVDRGLVSADEVSPEGLQRAAAAAQADGNAALARSLQNTADGLSLHREEVYHVTQQITTEQSNVANAYRSAYTRTPDADQALASLGAATNALTEGGGRAVGVVRAPTPGAPAPAPTPGGPGAPGGPAPAPTPGTPTGDRDLASYGIQPSSNAHTMLMQQFDFIENYPSEPLAKRLRQQLMDAPQFKQYLASRGYKDPDFGYREFQREARYAHRAIRHDDRRKRRQNILHGSSPSLVGSVTPDYRTHARPVKATTFLGLTPDGSTDESTP